MRHQYLFKYVDRYHCLRDWTNAPDFQQAGILTRHLTGHFRRIPRSWSARVRASFFKVEPTVLYGFMGGAALVLWLLLRDSVLQFPPGS